MSDIGSIAEYASTREVTSGDFYDALEVLSSLPGGLNIRAIPTPEERTRYACAWSALTLQQFGYAGNATEDVLLLMQQGVDVQRLMAASISPASFDRFMRRTLKKLDPDKLTPAIPIDEGVSDPEKGTYRNEPADANDYFEGMQAYKDRTTQERLEVIADRRND